MNRLGLTYYIGLLFTLLLISTVAMAQVKDTLYGTWGGWQNGASFHEGNPTNKVQGGYRNGKEHAGFIQFNTSSLAGYKPYNLKLHLKTEATAAPLVGIGVAISSITEGFAPYGDTSQAVIDDIMDGFYSGDGIMGIGFHTFDLSFSAADSVLISQLDSGKFQLGIAHRGPWRRYSSSESYLTLSYDTCIEYSYEIALPSSCNDTDGTITINVDSMGNPPYVYFWKRLNGPPLSNTDTSVALSYTIPNIGEGDWYQVSVAESNCVPDTQQIKIPETLELDVQDYRNVSCHGGTDGIIALTHGGNPPFIYSWSGAPSCSTSICTTLTAGMDSTVVTDGDGCTGSLFLPIYEPPSGDLGLQEIISPVSGCGLGMEPVTIKVRNNHDSIYAGGDLAYYSINDATPKSMVLTNIPKCNAVNITFPDSADLSDKGTYRIKAWIAFSNGDTIDLSNDSITDLVVVNDTLITSFPWQENFDSEPFLDTTCADFILQGVCKNAPIADTDWRIHNDNTPTPNTGTTGTSNGKFAYVEADCGQDKGAMLRTPCLEFDSLSSLILEYGYHMFDNGSGEMGGLYVDIWDGSWDTLDIIQGNQGASWVNDRMVYINGYSGIVKLQFRAITGTGIKSDIAIDGIELRKCFSLILNSSITKCNGDSSGSALVLNAIGGQTPFTYQWNDYYSQTTQVADSLCAGMYTVTVTDSNGCIATDSVEVTEPDLLTGSLSVTNVTCHGFSDGTATVTPTGGTPPYAYSWNDPSSQTDSVATGLDTGSYWVTITDINSCAISVVTPPITEPDSIRLTWNTIDHPSCYGSDGELKLKTSGSGGTFNFYWSDGDTTIGTGSSTNDTLSAGTYIVTVTSAAGQCDTAQITLVDSAFTISGAHTDETCAGLADGSAEVTGHNGGTPPYTYTWSTGDTNDTVTNLVAGTHFVSVTDANGGCTGFSTFNIQSGSSIQLSPSIGNILCNADSTSAQANPSGGNGPYTYLWNDPLAQTTNIADSLVANNWTVTVTDSVGCQADTSVDITEPSQIDVLITPIPSTCSILCDGMAMALVSGGTPGYLYSWNTNPVQTTPTSTGLCDGTYTLTVTDANGCMEIDSVTITSTSSITLSLSSTPATCGQNNGIATVFPAGSSPPYDYLWSTGDTTATASNLSAGPYSVTVTDNMGCFAVDNVIVNNTNGLIIAFTDSTMVSCNGGNDGEAQVTASLGTAPFSFSWSNGDTSPIVTDLTAGTYNITVTDGNLCQVIDSITITEPPALIINIDSVENVTCYASCNGGVKVYATGGTFPYLYSLNGGSGQSLQSFTGLCFGTDTITGTDANSCTADIIIAINEPAQLIATVNTDSVSCFGVCDGGASITVNGGSPPYNYVWDNNPSQSNDLITSLCVGTYTVLVTDTNGCIIFDSITISEPTALTEVISKNDISCNGACDGDATITVSGGTIPYTYIWNTGPIASTIVNLCPGTYTVTVTDNNGCNILTDTTLTQPLPLTTSTTNTWPLCAGDCNGTATVSVFGGTTPIYYLWNDTLAQTNYTATGLCGGSYIVVVQDANGCIDSNTALLASPPLLEVSTNPYKTSCYGSCDGSIAAYPLSFGGVPPYSYVWSDSSITDSTTGLCAGTYSVTLTDNNGCTDTDSATVLEPSALEIDTNSFIITDVTCYGDSDGAITVIASNGTPPYAYLWSNGDTTDTASTLLAGVHYVTVTDANLCTITDSFNINYSMRFIANAGQDTTICKGDNVTIGGAQGVYPPGTFSFSVWINTLDTNWLVIGDTVTVSPDTTTTYWLLLSSPTSECPDTDLVTIFVDSVYVNVGPDDTVCMATGSYKLDSVVLSSADSLRWGTSGWGSYVNDTVKNPTYNIDFQDINNGSVMLYCTGISGDCRKIDTMTLVFGPVPADSFIVDNLPCFGVADGQLTIHADTLFGPYTYNWVQNSSILDTTQTIDSLYAGDSLRVTIFSDYCTWSSSITMPGDIGHNVIFSYLDSIFCRNDTNTIYPFDYEPGGVFNADNGLIINDSSGAIIINEQDTGTYHVWYSFEGPCQITDSLDTFHLTLVAGPEINMIHPEGDTLHLCQSPDLSGLDTLIANPGGNWQSGLHLTPGNPLSGFAYFNPNDTGIFHPTYTIEDTNGCINSKTIRIIVHPPPKLQWSMDSTICRGDSVPVFNHIDLPSPGPFEISYSNSATGEFFSDVINKFDTIFLNPSQTTTYTLLTIVNLFTGCQGSQVGGTLSINVIDPPPPTIPNNILTYCKGDVIAPLVAINSDPAYTLAWFIDTIYKPSTGPVPGLPCDTGEATSTTWDPDISLPGVYPYSIYQFDDSLCCYSLPGVIVVEIIGETGCELVVYNAFSPNEDGNNDLWIIDGIGNHPNTITIYNRWEDVVQEFVNYDNKNVVWDGKNKNGKDVPDGTYFYVIKLETFSLHVENTITGWVQITNN